MEDLGAMKLADLIAARRGDRTYESLGRDSGLKDSVWVKWAGSGEKVNFPTPETIRGMAVALGVPQSEVLMAAARTVGLSVASDDPSVLRIAGAGLLPEWAREAVLATVRAMLLLANGKR